MDTTNSIDQMDEAKRMAGRATGAYGQAPTHAAHERTGGTLAEFRVVVSLEAILYLVLILLALALRLPELDVLPLNDAEAHEALAAFRVLEPQAHGTRPVSEHPLMFTANLLVMAIGGAGNVAARFATLSLGVAVVALPLLFRRWLGPANAVIVAGLFALSPVLLAASRSMSGPVWSLALALLLVSCLGRYFETRHVWYALAASVIVVMLALAAEPAGFLTLLGLAIGLGFALYTADDPERRYARMIREVLGNWPWLRAVAVSAIALVAVGTVFLLYPSALESVGAALDAGLRGFTLRPGGHPAAFPLLVSLLYEPLFWLFGLVGTYFVLSGKINPEREFIARALVGWGIASVIWSLVYPGAVPAHALWLTAPLVGLSAIAIEKALAPVRDPFWHVPTWGPWLHGIALVAILLIAGIHLLFVARALLNVGPALTPQLDQQDLIKLVMVMLALVLAVITFFLVGSIWGARGAWHGLGIGMLLFLGLYGFNAGWQVSVTRVDDPRELWHVRPPSRNLNLLVDTLRTASLRATGKPDTMELVVQLTPEMTDTGPLAWALHGFRKTTYVRALSNAVNAPVVISPELSEPPQLGANYVGQSFGTYWTWEPSTMSYWDFLPWLYDRQTRVAPHAEGRVIVWVRADVYGLDQDAEVPGFRAP